MSLFPAYIENDDSWKLRANEKKTPKEYEIDFKTGQLTGKIVEGLEAIKVWIWLTLQVARYRYHIYTWDYGSEFEDLIGQGYTDEHIEAEAHRMTEDCLLINEHIQSISDFSTNLNGSKLQISFTVNTIYGNLNIENIAIASAG